jgi:hypothetical protein
VKYHHQNHYYHDGAGRAGKRLEYSTISMGDALQTLAEYGPFVGSASFFNALASGGPVTSPQHTLVFSTKISHAGIQREQRLQCWTAVMMVVLATVTVLDSGGDGDNEQCPQCKTVVVIVIVRNGHSAGQVDVTSAD